MAVLAYWITCIFKIYSLSVCYITCRFVGIKIKENCNTNTLEHLLVLIKSLLDGSLCIFLLFLFNPRRVN